MLRVRLYKHGLRGLDMSMIEASNVQSRTLLLQRLLDMALWCNYNGRLMDVQSCCDRNAQCYQSVGFLIILHFTYLTLQMRLIKQHTPIASANRQRLSRAALLHRLAAPCRSAAVLSVWKKVSNCFSHLALPGPTPS